MLLRFSLLNSRQKRGGKWRPALLVSVLLLLVSCAGKQHHTPVDSRPQPPSIKIKTHTVAKGETLFSIAWRYGMDYRTLASANNISSDYTIYPGQTLHLNGKRSAQAKPTKSYSKPVSKAKTASQSAVKKAPVSRSKTTKTPTSPTPWGSIKWQWPASGKVIQRFSSSGTVNKGIDIQGKLGDPVMASAAGSVVYAGTGLLGYGKLVIVKHNDKFLSAYAHNRTLLVKEGDKVKAGEKIAEIGASGTQKIKLHFEIRRDGKPVDPEKYLPPR